MSVRAPLIDLSVWPQGDDRAPVPDAAALIAVASAAEAAGFSSLSALPDSDDAPLRAEGGIALGGLAVATTGIGLISAVLPGREHPYHAARRVAALDHISAGRAAWAVRGHALEAEYAGILADLWDGWRDDAIVIDKATGVLIRPGTIRHSNHAGPRYRVRGPLPVSRPPHGHPPLVLLVQLGDPLPATPADLLIVTGDDPAAALAYRDAAARLLFRPATPPAPETLKALAAMPGLDGISLPWAGADPALASISALSGLAQPSTGTLRYRLGLSSTPPSRALNTAKVSGAATPTNGNSS